MIELIGYLGGLALSLCGLPAAISAIRSGEAEINSGMLWLWLIGEILMLVYVCLTVVSIPLIFNYAANIVLLSIIAKYKYWPRVKEI